MKKIHFFYLLIVATVVSISVYEVDFNDRFSKPINGDGKGYYAYLPALFIYGDFSYSFVDKMEAKYYPEDQSHAKGFPAQQPNGTVVNKYFPGVALFYLPFFALAAFLSAVFGIPVDGYSILFQWSVPVAHWFYLFCSLLVLSDTFFKLQFKKWSILTGLILVTFATNLMYYVVYDFTVTHLFGFFGCSLLIWCLVKYQLSHSFRYAGLFICFLALLLLVRPTNLMMVIAVPLVLDWKSILEVVKPRTWLVHKRWIYILVALFILFLAPLLWKVQSGKWIVYSYGEEGFNFFQPQLLKYLLSYEKGWFLWSPIILVMLILGGIYFYRLQKNKGIVYFLSFLVITYIFSCWWIWTFGMAFGQRPMIDFYPIILLGFVGFLNTLKVKWYLLLAVPFIALNYVQTFQYHEGILNDKTVDGKIYWSHFLQLKHDPPRVVVSQEWKKVMNKSVRNPKVLNAKSPFSSGVEFDSLPNNAKVVVTCALSGEHGKTSTELILSDSTGSFYRVHYLNYSIYNTVREMQFSFNVNQKIDSPLRCFFLNVNDKYPVKLKQFVVNVYEKK